MYKLYHYANNIRRGRGYTPDAARATAILGNTDSAYNQVWHLPTSSERLTGKAFVDLANGIKRQKSSYRILSPALLTIGGVFDRTIKELIEMQYQNNQDYFFNSDKFCETFQFTPTRYEDGIRKVLESVD